MIDQRVATKHKDFLLDDLRADALTIQHYAGTLIPNLFVSGHRIDDIACRKLIAELAEHTDLLRKETKVQSALSACAFIPCHDGMLRTAKAVYLLTAEVTDLLSTSAPTAVLPNERTALVKDFLQWLGVAEFPRPTDVVSRINELIQNSPAIPSNRELIQNNFFHLGIHWNKFSHEQQKEFEPLRTMQWLPAQDRSDRWYSPSEVYTHFARHLFETTGQFLDASYKQQQQASELIAFLQIETDPTCHLVVKHILRCAADNKEVNKAVYAFLNRADKVDDPAILQLKGKACLPLDGIGYVRPDQVFWKNHRLHPFRFSLGHEFEAYSDLLRVLEVGESPQAADAIKLLCEIVDSNENRHLNASYHAVIMECWALISDALQKQQIEPSALKPLRHRKVIPNRDGYLQKPDWMFFEDRSNLAERFGEFLQANVILPTPFASLGMRLAGVRPLSRAVRITLVECLDAAPANDLKSILHERRHLIERVISPVRAEDEGWNTAFLERLQIQWSSRLEVGYTLHAFNQQISLQPEQADTYYDADNEILYVHHRVKSRPWLDIASGLAYAMNPDAEEGTIAPGLFVALDALSLQSGSAALDKLKIPPLDLEETYQTTVSAPLSMGGTEAPPVEGGISPEPQQNSVGDISLDDDTEPASDLENESQTKEVGSAGDAHTRDVTSEWSIDATGNDPSTDDLNRATSTVNIGNTTATSGGTKGITTSSFNDLITSVPTGEQSSTLREPQLRNADDSLPQLEGRTRRRIPSFASDHASEDRDSSIGRMRTYVFSTPVNETDEETRRRNTEPIDRAGMERVLAAEQQDGRLAEAMPHNNPGYDIFSRDEQGENERYIEVKSLSGDWQVKGVLVSATQFTFAQQIGPKFWLYVVERADKDDFQITRIQNPAQRVNEYWFDDGWRNCSENTNDDNGTEAGN